MCADIIRTILTYFTIKEICSQLIKINKEFYYYFVDISPENTSLAKTIISYQYGKFESLDEDIYYDFYGACQDSNENRGVDLFQNAHHLMHHFFRFSSVVQNIEETFVYKNTKNIFRYRPIDFFQNPKILYFCTTTYQVLKIFIQKN